MKPSWLRGEWRVSGLVAACGRYGNTSTHYLGRNREVTTFQEQVATARSHRDCTEITRDQDRPCPVRWSPPPEPKMLARRSRARLNVRGRAKRPVPHRRPVTMTVRDPAMCHVPGSRCDAAAVECAIGGSQGRMRRGRARGWYRRGDAAPPRSAEVLTVVQRWLATPPPPNPPRLASSLYHRTRVRATFAPST